MDIVLLLSMTCSIILPFMLILYIISVTLGSPALSERGSIELGWLS